MQEALSLKRIFILLLVCIFGVHFMAQEDTLVLGVFPQRNEEITFKLYSPFTSYLSKKMGRNIRLDISKDFDSFWYKMENDLFDIVHCNGYQYLVAHKKYNFHLLGVIKRHGRTTMTGTIIVRKDSGINSIADLQGKEIVFGGGLKSSRCGIIAKKLLLDGGLSPQHYRNKFALSPPNAALAVYLQQVDAAGISDDMLESDFILRRMDLSQIRVLARGQQYIHLPWACSNKVDPELRASIQAILLSMNENPEGREALNTANYDAIVFADDSDFNSFREAVFQVNGEHY